MEQHSSITPAKAEFSVLILFLPGLMMPLCRVDEVSFEISGMNSSNLKLLVGFKLTAC